MRVALYNRYWRTRGGGERYAGAVAEILSRNHRMELLGPEEVGLQSLSEHLGLDLSRSSFRLIPRGSERELVPITAEYDLFINCTYLSRLPSQAARSVYLVLFPQKAWPRGIVRTGQRLTEPLISDEPDPVVPLEGFVSHTPGGSCWSRNAARLRVQPWAFRRGRARVRLATPEDRGLADTLVDVRAPGIAWSVRGDDLVVERRGKSEAQPIDMEIRCRTFVPAELGLSEDRRRLGVCLVDQAGTRPWARLRWLAERVRGRFDAHDAEIPSSYDLLLSISEYTREWVATRWGRSSEVLAPPVDTAKFRAPAARDKEKILLSVGRFFHGSHNKKHLEMLRVFRGMVDRGEIPKGWEYHLVGNLHRDRLVDLEYFAELERLAEGYPVTIHVDLGLDRLVDLYRRASIFWHAAGWGENERRQPEKLEHFGLTTCEAMASGCIPVVIAKAGQLEIVDHGESGFLFETGRELAAITRRLIAGHGEAWTREMMERASTTVERFAKPQFEKRLLNILEAYDLLE